MDFLCGIALTLLIETAVLILATEWLRKRNDKMNVRDD